MDVARLVLDYLRVIFESLAWPIAIILLALLFRREIREISRRLSKAILPGGVSFELQEEILEAKKLSTQLEPPTPPADVHARPVIPLTDANKRMLELGLRPSPSGMQLDYYRGLAEQDPNLALAGIRIELEVLIRNLAKGFKLEFAEHESLNEIVRRLHKKLCITSEQRKLIEKIAAVCNAAVHGVRATKVDAAEVIEIAAVLTEQYVAWLSWGFNG